MSAPVVGFVVVAAGTGSRLRAAQHKALVELAGSPLVEHTLRRLLAASVKGPLVLVAHADDRSALEALAATLPTPVCVVTGGARRQDSVSAGLAALPPEVNLVLVHDAARPFVPLDALPGLVDAAARSGAALLASPVADTIKRARADETVAETVDRSELRAAQTPQAFRREELETLLAEAESAGAGVTDEAALFEAAGRTVVLVPGSRLNFKLTTPEDLALARALLNDTREEHHDAQ